MDWPSEFARELANLSGEDLMLQPEESSSILALARKIAHSTERRNAPLSTYLAGMFVAIRSGEGISREQALAEAEIVAARLIANLDAVGEAVDVETIAPEKPD